jgi:hypothetical protein
MIVEQIRYFIGVNGRQELLRARRAMNGVRDRLGLPPGHILVADETVEESPGLIWQCAYADEGELATATNTLMGEADYEATRDQLAQLAVRIELELYTMDEEGEPVVELEEEGP